MERRKALIASTAAAAVLVVGAVGYASASGLAGRTDGVGQPRPTASTPQITVVIDPATGAVTAATAQDPTTRPVGGRDDHDEEHEADNRQEGHESDD